MDLSTRPTWACSCATRSWHPPRRLSYTVDGVRRLADAGVGIVLFSLFESNCESKPRATPDWLTTRREASPRRSATSRQAPRRTPAHAAT